jgi:hypothetical protein
MKMVQVTQRDITLKDLTLKLTMLIALVSAQRRQSIRLLNIDYMVKDDTSGKRVYYKKTYQTVKTWIYAATYRINPNICIVSTLNEYMNTTAAYRGEHKQLLLRYVKPCIQASHSGNYKSMAKIGSGTGRYSYHII